MNIETAEKAKELVEKRKHLHNQYISNCGLINIRKEETGDELFNKIKLLLWQEINKLDEQIEAL